MAEPEGGARQPVDLAGFDALAAECGWTRAEFAAFYADGTRKEMAALRAASARGDLGEIVRLAHGARGSSATACLPDMANAFQLVERAAAGGDGAKAARLLDAAGVLLEAVLRELGSV